MLGCNSHMHAESCARLRVLGLICRTDGFEMIVKENEGGDPES